jgi:hypothetical protein
MAPLLKVSQHLLFLVAAAVAVSGLPLAALAQSPTTNAPAGAEVEVRSVKFATVRPPNGGDAWLESTVELGVNPNPAAGPYGRFADRVQVTLLLSLRTRENDYTFYRASAEAVTLEAGRAAIRFYLPPEVLQREQVNTDPFAYAVEVAVGGRPVTPGAGSLSSSLRTGDPQRAAELLRTFKDRAAQAAPRNDGVMVPQYLSPFATAYGNDTPAFVRRER